MAIKEFGDDTGLDTISPETHEARDACYFRAIVRANEGYAAAQDNLDKVVQEARDAGESWSVIGAALGISRQGAQQRFGRRKASAV